MAGTCSNTTRRRSNAEGVGLRTAATTKEVAEESDRYPAGPPRSLMDEDSGSPGETSEFKSQVCSKQRVEGRDDSDKEMKDAEKEDARKEEQSNGQS